VRAGAKLSQAEQFKVCTTDLAPTLAYLLGIEPPAQSEGRLLREFLSDCTVDRPARSPYGAARPIVQRPTTRPQPIRLQGDVTDEA
jgi:hypothetical protein